MVPTKCLIFQAASHRNYNLLSVELQLSTINILLDFIGKTHRLFTLLHTIKSSTWHHSSFLEKSLQKLSSVPCRSTSKYPTKTFHRESLLCSGQPLRLPFTGEQNTKPSQRPNLSIPAPLDPTIFLLVSSSHIHTQAAMMVCQENRLTSHNP